MEGEEEAKANSFQISLSIAKKFTFPLIKKTLTYKKVFTFSIGMFLFGFGMAFLVLVIKEKGT